jgi:hypothetical protein
VFGNQREHHMVCLVRVVSVPANTVVAYEQRSRWASSAGNKFRQVARESENPATKLLAEGLTDITEALRELCAELANVEKRIAS